MIIISNTSPINNLAEIGQLNILQNIYNQIIIPKAVYNDLIHPGAGEIVINAVKNSDWIKVQSIQNQSMVKQLQNKINVGKAEAITLACEFNADQLIMDERLGRREAKGLGLNITGVLGVLVIAKNRNLITAVKPLIDDLIDNAVFRVSPQLLYRDILQAANEDSI
ncbi:MAG: DUF3368 domain-containing protein [Moorea sp. SIO2B7]|nr:DUF3368 domain-containing protein [Moorena sp. SIO2B7]